MGVLHKGPRRNRHKIRPTNSTAALGRACPARSLQVGLRRAGVRSETRLGGGGGLGSGGRWAADRPSTVLFSGLR